MAHDALMRLVLISDGWPLDAVYWDQAGSDPEGDEHFIIMTLEEARDVWKPEMDATVTDETDDPCPDTLPGGELP